MRATFPERAAAIDAYLIAQDFEGQLAAFRGHFNPPRGECLLARLDGAPVGVVMLKPYAAGVCELNRMYVVPAARGRGVGRRLCERCSRAPASSATARSGSTRSTNGWRRCRSTGRSASAPIPTRPPSPAPTPTPCRCAWPSENPATAEGPECPAASPAPPMPTCTARPPATGVRLADTDLVVEVERDLTIYGEEVKFGGGK